MTAYRRESRPAGRRRGPGRGAAWHPRAGGRELPAQRRPPVHPALIRAYGAVKLACAALESGLGPWDADSFGAIDAGLRGDDGGGLDDAHRRRCAAGRRGHVDQHERQRGAREPRAADPRADARRLRPSARTTTSTCTSRRTTRIPRRCASRRSADCFASSRRASSRSSMRSRTKERALADVVKVGRTQLQDAVLTTLGRSMGAYAEAFARDRWRIYKCEERLRVVNLGGRPSARASAHRGSSSFGVGRGAARDHRLGLARAENLVDATQNVDAFVEVSGITQGAVPPTCSRFRTICACWPRARMRGWARSRCPRVRPARRSCRARSTP
jgi:aspartate ammonia-lyase